MKEFLDILSENNCHLLSFYNSKARKTCKINFLIPWKKPVTTENWNKLSVYYELNMEVIPKYDIKSDIRFDIRIKPTTWTRH